MYDVMNNFLLQIALAHVVYHSKRKQARITYQTPLSVLDIFPLFFSKTGYKNRPVIWFQIYCFHALIYSRKTLLLKAIKVMIIIIIWNFSVVIVSRITVLWIMCPYIYCLNGLIMPKLFIYLNYITPEGRCFHKNSGPWGNDKHLLPTTILTPETQNCPSFF